MRTIVPLATSMIRVLPSRRTGQLINKVIFIWGCKVFSVVNAIPRLLRSSTLPVPAMVTERIFVAVNCKESRMGYLRPERLSSEIVVGGTSGIGDDRAALCDCFTSDRVAKEQGHAYINSKCIGSGVQGFGYCCRTENRNNATCLGLLIHMSRRNPCIAY